MRRSPRRHRDGHVEALATANPPRFGNRRRSRSVPRRGSRTAGFSFRSFDAAAVLGILNVTPDSFSDGGRYLNVESAVAHALRLVADGASAIDVGGESTRPGARSIGVDEEVRRVVPVIERLRGCTAISIDTTKSVVAERAIEAGATIINDVSAGLADPRILEVAAESGAGVVLMHRKGTPQTMQRRARYRDVVSDVTRFLAERVEAALRAGIRLDRIAVDPGIGFAKTLSHNLRLLAHLDEIVALGLPVVIGVSRKTFLGTILGAPVEQREEGTIAASLLAVGAGAAWVRVHDVLPVVRALRVARAIWGAAGS